ncbi:nuclear transport factor 2 family protein [Arenibaculum sp.]|uniref:nuclear transport factor 2 family protein n=1 Tax=Arenibaculum sp. TaxID=2865862 RepID=UPI002E0D7555|nr:nuclear transport factor 2 family protein [Arenibaculum sp.]
MADAVTIAERYVALWNETDPARRRALLARAWVEDGTYVDPLMQGQGHDQIDALVGAVHARFPGLRFAVKGTPDGYGDRVRFSWTLGPEGGESLVEGTDFAILDGDRLKSVTGFLDKVPAVA